MDNDRSADARKIWSARVSRRSLLEGAACVGGAATILGVTASHAGPAKMSQSAAGYKDSPQGDQNCANCAPFEPPSSCKIVEGTVSPQGWCKVWQRKT